MKFDASLRMVVLAWFSSRVLLWAFVMLGHRLLQTLPPMDYEKDGAWRGVSSYWLNAWTTFDSQYLIGIAQNGYTTTKSAAFFPLYPFLLRFIGTPNDSENTLALVGVIISNLAFLGALWLLFCLTRDEWGEEVAKRAVWIEAFFPSVAFSAAVYTESLFLFLSIGFFYAARRKQWWISGLCGLLGGLTRNSGLILCVALLLDRPKAPLSGAEKRSRFLCALCPFVALLLVQLFLQRQVGVSSLEVQKEFGRALTFPLLPIWLDLQNIVLKSTARSDFVTIPTVAICLLTFALLWMYRKRFSAGKLFFIGSILLLNLTLSWLNEPHTNSTLRFLLGTFPAAQLFALACYEKASSRRATLYLATAGIALFFAHSCRFGLKDFLG